MSNVKFLDILPDPGLITGAALADMVGLTEGEERTFMNAWVHLKDGDTELYLSLKPLRSGVSWETLNDLGLIDGTRTVKIDDDVYKVRVPSGVTRKPTMMSGAYNPTSTHDSEWNRLIYPLHWDVHIDTKNDGIKRMGRVIDDDFKGVTDSDLGVHFSITPGSRSWCQERFGNLAIQRGMFGVSYLTKDKVNRRGEDNGWRPILEKVVSV